MPIDGFNEGGVDGVLNWHWSRLAFLPSCMACSPYADEEQLMAIATIPGIGTASCAADSSGGLLVFCAPPPI